MNRLDFSEANFDTISLHHVGNKGHEQGYWTSKHPLHLVDDARIQILKSYLLTGFNSPRWYTFSHETDVDLNQSYVFSKKILHNHEAFHSISKQFTEHLYECTEHPWIQDGEVYFVQMSGVKVGLETYEAFGIFKSESKLKFLQAVAGEEDYELVDAEGFSGIEYGAIIINYSPIDNYYLVSTYQPKQNAEVFEYYWKSCFLGLKEVDTNYVETEKIIKFFAAYFKEHQGSSMQTVQMIHYLNKVSKYLNDMENFERQELEYLLFKEPNIITDFWEYWTNYQEDNNITLRQEFLISKQAYKDHKKLLNHKIHLDKNFVLEIKGNIDYVKHGVDETQGLRYYTLYYKMES